MSKSILVVACKILTTDRNGKNTGSKVSNAEVGRHHVHTIAGLNSLLASLRRFTVNKSRNVYVRNLSQDSSCE